MLHKILKAAPKKSLPPVHMAGQSIGMSRSAPPAKVRSLSVLSLNVHYNKSKTMIP